MRRNFPVFDIETQVGADQFLISRTDAKGRISYANPAFVEISGFSLEELLGSPHNLVRHPDMPAGVFADLWQTVSAGDSWLGVVKNRRKDGGYYWVLANVTPMFEGDVVVGYASVRVRASDAQKAMAESVYERMREGGRRAPRVRRGQVLPTGWGRWAAALRLPFGGSLRGRFLRQALVSGGLLALAGGMGLAAAWPRLPANLATLFACVLGAAVAAVCVNARRLYGTVAASFDQAADAARQVAAGDLTLQFDGDGEGEIGRLAFCLEVMRRSLLGIARDVAAGIDGTVEASADIERGNADLANRTEEQATSLEQTTASMKDLTSTVRQNADHASQANRLAADSLDAARRGGEVVDRVVGAMQSIAASSRKISDIVGIIEGIAFQTNILALNAAVEAARAGASGKGFAVVAGEVRALAQKSAHAAREIKDLILESEARVAEGSDQAGQAGVTIREIVEAVRHVTDIMADISSASLDQARGIEQVDSAIAQMDGLTHQNAALVQRLGETTGQLGLESARLRNAIAVFRTGARRRLSG